MPPGTQREIASVFLKLGTTAFGGPAAHVAMMNDEIVHKRGWLTETEFLDAFSATHFIPGPNSTELAIHLGYVRGGWRGLLVAGVCFILPAAFLVALLAACYVTYGNLPWVQALLFGIKPVIVAVVLKAILALSKTAVKNRFLAWLAVGSLIANLAGANELVVIAIAGAVAAFQGSKVRLHGLLPIWLMEPALIAGGVEPFAQGKLFLFFLKVGSVLFGSGYVLVAFLKADLVDRWHWLSETQLLDAIAIGQVTPGPVFTTATFIGFLLGGATGAALATLGIFLPAFFFVAFTGRLISLLRASSVASATLDGVNVASLAVMAAATFFLAKTAVIDFTTVSLFVVSAIALIRLKLNSIWLVTLGAAVGLLVYSGA